MIHGILRAASDGARVSRMATSRLGREAPLFVAALALALLACKKDKSDGPKIEINASAEGGSVTVGGDKGQIKVQGGGDGGSVTLGNDKTKIEVGNTGGDCKAGDTCACSGMGNCTKTCAGPGCEFSANGMGNATFKCPDGKCTLKSQAIGNVTLDCKGGGCALECSGTGNCTLTGCSSGCSVKCKGVGTCSCASGC